ncbi:Disease resistance protein [Arachis hypogaea]|nr:Disease resistance protein [Arachis hypogaea]
MESLESLVVSDCSQLREIVDNKGEDVVIDKSGPVKFNFPILRKIVGKKGEDDVIDKSGPVKFNLPKLTSVKLSKLSKFKSFYSSGAYELSCPALNDLSIQHCDLLEPFEEIPSHAKTKSVLFPEKSKTGEVKVKEVINNKLKSMHIESRHVVGSSMEYDYRRDSLEELQLSRLNNSDIIYCFLHCNPNLKSLCLNDCDFEELKPDAIRRPGIGVVPKLKSLTLTNMYDLKKICFEQDAVLQKIESLVIIGCYNLHTIAPSSVSLAHLTILEVVGCRYLKYVMSTSTAKSLGQLKTMKVINCGYLEEIVSEKTQEGQEEKENVGTDVPIIFKQLTTLELVSLESLHSFCSSINCAFKFPSLQNFILWVSDYDKDLEPIWRNKEGPRKDWFSGLKTLTLYAWDASNTHAIPSNVLCCLKSLQELQVEWCNTIESIFEMDDTKSWESSFQLKKLTLNYLTSLKSVWQHDKREILLGFQNLQQVTIIKCDKLTSVFPTVLARDLKKLEELDVSDCAELQEIVGKDQEKVVEGSQKFVFPCLTTLRLFDLPQLRDLDSGRLSLECPELKQLELYPKQLQKYPEDGVSKVEKLYLNELYSFSCYNDDGENSTSPFEILADKMLPKLEILQIYRNNCKTMNIPKEAGERMLHLKELKLRSLSELNSISGLEYLLKLRLLEVYECHKLITVLELHSYSNLKELHIKDCNGLECLLTSSAVKMLIHLEELKVEWCNSLKEIVQQESGTEDIIEFKHLHRITLADLGSLECFYSGNATLQFPSLIRLDILDCSDMKIFSHVKLPLFQVFYSFSEAERLFLHDLNVAIVCQFLQQKDVVFGHHPALKDIWLDKVHIPAEAFSAGFNWESLVVEGCDELFTTAILPSHLLPFLSQLQELEVRGCNSSVETIFEVKDTIIDIPLKKLTLEHLPTLSHIWNKDPKGSSLSFSCLKEVVVNGCKSLTSLLPASLPMSNMKKIDVKNCEELVEIVTKDEADNKETNKELAMFPKLTSLTLHNLPNLTYIYAGMEILNLPELRELDISHCKFATDSTAKVVTPHLDLDRLSIDMEGVMMLYLDPENIKYLRLQGFNDIHDSDAASAFNFFPKKVPLPNIQMLVVVDSVFKNIFPSKKPEIIHSQLLIKELELRNLHKLESIGLEHTWVTFSNLTWLKVEGCASLKYLFTSSTAKCLVQLKELCISNCEALESLMVDYQPHDDDHDVIKFEKLEKLSLNQIPKLESFYKGNSTLNFPSLKEVEVTECNRLEYLFTFSTAKNLQHLFKMEISKCESLETVVLATQKGDKSQADLTFSDLAYLTLSELPKLESLFTENSSTLNFPSLKDVEVTKCNRLEYMFTFSTAKSLHKLGNMQISKCESLKTVVLAEADEPRELTFSDLWNLSLSESPKLGSFFTGKSTLKFQAYLYIEITQCKIMKTFPHGDVEAPELEMVEIDGVSCSIDNLNAAVSQQFEKRSSQH